MKYLSLLLLVLVFGCSSKEKPRPIEVIEIKHTYIYNKCEQPLKPSYTELSSESHIGSAYNMNILLDNLYIMSDYVTSLQNAIDCYDKQTEN